MAILDITINDAALQSIIDAAVQDALANNPVVTQADVQTMINALELPLSGGTKVIPFETTISSTDQLETRSKMVVSEDAEGDPIYWYSLMRYRLDNHPKFASLGGFKAGDTLTIYAEAHATNNEPRSKGIGVAWVTEFRLKDSIANERENSDADLFNVAMNHDSGSYNVGVEAHHAMVGRQAQYTFTEDYPEGQKLYFIYMTHVKTTNVPNDSSPDFDVSQNRGHLNGMLIRQ